MSRGIQMIHTGDLRAEKLAESTGAKGELSVRAPSGHDFTQAQHLMQRLASVRNPSGLIAPVGHTPTHTPQPPQSFGSWSGMSLTGFSAWLF